MTRAAAAKTVSVLTPEARKERALRLLGESVLELLSASRELDGSTGEWIDQHHSPLGKEKHMRLCRAGKLPSRKVGKRILVRRDDLNAYIEREGLSRGRRLEEEDVVDIVERIQKGGRR